MIETIPNPTGDGPATYKPGRVCTSCPTILSIYTRGTRCAQCNPPVQRLTRFQHEHALQELMELIEGV